MDRWRHAVTAMLAVAWLASSAHAKKAPGPELADADAGEAKVARETGLVIHDGKGHYLVFGTPDPATTKDRGILFYGDGTTFHRVVVKTYSEEDNLRTWAILDYRMGLELDRSKLVLTNATFTMTCRDATSTTVFTPLPAAEARELLAKAAFKVTRMDRNAYALGRDGTTYYYVDRAASPPGNKDFRVYVGKRGAMKQLKLKDIASDSSGTVFTSNTGTLRVGKPLSLTWARKPAKPTELSVLPIDANYELVYRELGVYTGKRFGLPCDDM